MKHLLTALLLFMSCQAFAQTTQFTSQDVFQISNSHGWLDIGPKNSSFSHFYTSLPGFFFSKKIVLNGVLEPYNGQYLSIETDHGTLDIGARNGSFSHFYTSLPGFFFSKKVEFNGPIKTYNQNYLKIETDHGFLEIGPRNSSFSHFETDLPRFFFNKKITVNGAFSSYNQDLMLETQETPRMTIQNTTGYVGIGTTTPDHELDVVGTIRSQEVLVEVTNGPDYVFEPDYSLLSLKEIKNYIIANKHLPEVPPAREMESEGVEVGKFNMLLLKKVEELTLHQIDLLEQLEKQNELLLKQQERIDQLEADRENR